MFLVNVLILFCLGVLSDGEILEPTSSCYNRFEYEYHVLQELVNHARQLKDLEGRIDAGGNETCACSNTTTCADGWVSYKGSCYLFDNDQDRTFGNAESFCAHFGATLVHVNDVKENDFILGILKHFNKKDWWVGLTDSNSEGNWRLVGTNTTAEFTAWNSGQPDNTPDQNCAEYYQPQSFRWHDTGCNKNNHPICEKRLQ